MAKIVGVVQARIGSVRLPGKVMADICGQPMLERIVRRLRRASALADVVLSIPDTVENGPLWTLAERMGVPCYAGSERDLISRIFHTARMWDADAIVRITGDCPFVDAYVVDQIVRIHEFEQVDYTSNVCPPTYPDGLDVEVYSTPLLHRLWVTIEGEADRENFPSYLWRNQELAYERHNVYNEDDMSGLRWTVDYPEDLEFVRAVYAELGDYFWGGEVLELLECKPEINRRNDV